MEVDFSWHSERVIWEIKQIISWRGKPQVIGCADLGFCYNGSEYISSAIQNWAPEWRTGWNTFSRATHSKMLMLSGSTGRYDTSGCYSTIGTTWQRFKTLQRSGCGLTTMTNPIWPLAELHLSRDWPWLRTLFSRPCKTPETRMNASDLG